MKKFNGVVQGSDRVITGADVSYSESRSNAPNFEAQGFCENDELG